MQQKIFITGASSEIGFALAEQYLLTGAIVGLFARRKTELEKLKDKYTSAVCYAGDVANFTSIQKAAKDFLENYGATNIVIANAGMSSGTATCLKNIETIKKIYSTNFMGTVHTFAAFIGSLKTRKQGKLVGISRITQVLLLTAHQKL